LKKPAPLTDKEKREISHYKRLQKEVHKGPLYTQPTKRDANAPAKTFGEDQFNRQYSTNPKADFDPFTGVETYSQRFQPKKNEIPKFAGRPFSKFSVSRKKIISMLSIPDKELFPKELWPALEGEAGEEVRKHLDRAREKKAAMMGAMKDKDKKPDDRAKIVLEKISSAIPGDEDGEEVDEEQEEDEGMQPQQSLAIPLLIILVQRLTLTSMTSPWEVITMPNNTSTMARTTVRAKAVLVTTKIFKITPQYITTSR
jgi:DNA-directed RNA polymerase III subunit Rpc31